MKDGLSEIQEKWLDFLLFVACSENNHILSFEYFSFEFTQQPEQFYEFIHFLYHLIKKDKNIERKRKIAYAYVHILSPLCQRLGFHEEKKILDNLCFICTEPIAYKRVSRNLHRYKNKSFSFIASVTRKLNKVLKKHQFKFEIEGRYKSTYSVYKKLKIKQKKSIQSLGDIFAFRIIVKTNSKEDCFKMLNVLHNEFTPIPKRYKDYITIPKINGYQSLHTGLNQVVPYLDLPIEVQIRTKTMDDFAERGIAAHWLYSRYKRSTILNEKEKKLIKHFHSFNEENSVYFFSFDGDLYKMDKGATVLDFAYKIHTKMGNKFKLALVNGKNQDLTYAIQEGDKIELILSKRKQVNKTWLDFTNDKNTRKKIVYATRNT